MTSSNRPSITDFYEMSESKKMNILWTGVSEIWNKVAELETSSKAHNALLIVGDGDTLPLVERMRNAEGYISNLKYWGRFIGGALVLQTLAFLFTVIVAIVRFLPLLEKIAAQP